jgi:hypothetical protein
MRVETRKLIHFLQGVKQGARVSYDTLRQVAGLDVQKEGYRYLYSARTSLVHCGVRFEVERMEGLRRMTDSEVARSGPRSMRLVGKMARREGRRVGAVNDFDSLKNEDKIQHNAALSVLGAVAHFTRPVQIKILEAAVAEAHSRLPAKGSVEVIHRALARR